LPVPYYHVVFTLPASIGALAFHIKAVAYDLLFKTAAETLLTIAADPAHRPHRGQGLIDLQRAHLCQLSRAE